MTVLHRIETPQGLRFHYSEPDDLGEDSTRELEKCGVDEAWYWYLEVGCEGSGEMIYRVGDKFGYRCLDHCSCYGPTTGFDTEPPTESLTKLLFSMSDELRDRVKSLEVAIREAQWK